MINPDPNMGGSSRSSSEIESDIRRTRSRMDATLDELGSRLTARSVIHTLLDIWEQRSPETPRSSARTQRVTGALSRQVAHQVRENPVPTLLIGAGIAWFLFDREDRHQTEYVELSGRRDRVDPSVPSSPSTAGSTTAEYEYQDLDYEEIDRGPGLVDRAKAKLSEGKEAIADAAAATREKIHDLGDSAKHRASELRGSAEQAARTARYRASNVIDRSRDRTHYIRHNLKSGYSVGTEKFTGAVREYPLGVGIGFAALGALMGLLLPHTRKEDELLGERSDEIIDVVKEKGRETLDRTKVVAERVAETALDEAQKHGFTAEAASQKLTELASKAGEVAKKVKDEAAAAAEEQKLMPKEQQSSGDSDPFASSTGSAPAQVHSGHQSVTMPPKGTGSGGLI
jgi:ElaB/YqjD/DUF883 family membrane-anchored ribosome-binding protein